MTLQLAELPAPEAPASVGWFVLIIFAICGGLYYLLAVWDRLVGKHKAHKTELAGQPIEVREASAFVTVTAHKEAITEIKDELKRQSARRAEIYDVQRAQSAAIARLDEKSDLMNAQLVRQDGKIDRILERLPRSHDS